MSPAAPQPIDRSDAGFTIIEVLIALALVAVSIVAIGSVMATNVRGVRSLEQHVTLMQTARSIMTTGIPPRAELGPGALSGEINDYQWKIDVGPLGGAGPCRARTSPGYPHSSEFVSDPPPARFPTFAPFA